MRSGRYTLIYWIRAAALLIATAFIFIGVSRGEVSIVIRKAVRICLECIGV